MHLRWLNRGHKSGYYEKRIFCFVFFFVIWLVYDEYYSFKVQIQIWEIINFDIFVINMKSVSVNRIWKTEYYWISVLLFLLPWNINKLIDRRDNIDLVINLQSCTSRYSALLNGKQQLFYLEMHIAIFLIKVGVPRQEG